MREGVNNRFVCGALAEAVVPARVAVPLAGNEGSGSAGRGAAAHHLPHPRELSRRVRKSYPAPFQVSAR